MNKGKFEIIDNAYNRLKIEMAQNPTIMHNAIGCLRNLEQDLMNWNGSCNTIDFLRDYFDGDGPNAVASIRIGRMFYSNFEIFMNDNNVRSIICDLLSIRKNQNMDFRIIRKIIENGFIPCLEGFNFTSGSRPLIYGNRFIVLLFHQVMTTIIDRRHLEDTGSKLGIKGVKDLRFEALQNQIREHVNDYIVEKKIDNESDFIKAAIAWWIVDANN